MADAHTVRFLQKVSLLSGLSATQLAVIANILQRQLVPPGKALFREGDPAECFFIIVQGSFGVYRLQREAVGEPYKTLGPGDVVGELCLLDEEPHASTVVATGAGIVLRGERRLFDRLTRRGDSGAFRIVDTLCRDLCARLHLNNRILREFQPAPSMAGEASGGGVGDPTPPTGERSDRTQPASAIRPQWALLGGMADPRSPGYLP